MIPVRFNSKRAAELLSELRAGRTVSVNDANDALLLAAAAFTLAKQQAPQLVELAGKMAGEKVDTLCPPARALTIARTAIDSHLTLFAMLETGQFSDYFLPTVEVVIGEEPGGPIKMSKGANVGDELEKFFTAIRGVHGLLRDDEPQKKPLAMMLELADGLRDRPLSILPEHLRAELNQLQGNSVAPGASFVVALPAIRLYAMATSAQTAQVLERRKNLN